MLRSMRCRSAVPAAEHGQQRGDAEVEALEQQEAGPEHRDGGEPEGLQVHVRLLRASSVGELEDVVVLGSVGAVGGRPAVPVGVGVPSPVVIAAADEPGDQPDLDDGEHAVDHGRA